MTRQGSASAFVARPPLGATTPTARGDGPLLVRTSPLPAACTLAGGIGGGERGVGRRGGAGALEALLGGFGSGSGLGPSTSRGSGEEGWRGPAATALWMARRETWTDIPMKDFYDALATYMYVFSWRWGFGATIGDNHSGQGRAQGVRSIDRSTLTTFFSQPTNKNATHPTPQRRLRVQRCA